MAFLSRLRQTEKPNYSRAAKPFEAVSARKRFQIVEQQVGVSLGIHGIKIKAMNSYTLDILSGKLL